MKTTRTEHVEAVHLMRVVKLHEGRFPELRLLHAIPNGGARNKIVAAKMKAEGVKAGVPDFHLPVARGEFHGLYVELKRETGGRLAPEQRVWLDLLTEQKYRAVVAKGWEQAWNVVREYLEAA